MTPRKGRRAWSGWTVPSLRATLSTTNFMQIAKPSMAPRNMPRNPPRHVPASRTDSLSLVNLWYGDIANWALPFGWNVAFGAGPILYGSYTARTSDVLV